MYAQKLAINVELKLIGSQHSILSLKLLTDHEPIGKADI